MSGDVLPAGWQVASLGSVTKIISGGTPSSGVSNYWNGDVPWVGPADLAKLAGGEVAGGTRTITEAGLKSSGARWIPAGSVVMSSRAPIGYLAIAARDLTTNQGCKSFAPSEQIDSRFLYWRLKHEMPAISALGSGATFSEVSRSKLAAHTITFPTLAEQRRIAERLDSAMVDITVARSALMQQREGVAKLHAAAVLVALRGRAVAAAGDPVATHADWVSLSDVARLESGHTPSRKHPEWWNGDVPWIALPDIRALDGRTATTTAERTNALGLANSSARLLPVGTIVLSRTASVGFVTVMGAAMATSQDFVNWVPGERLRSWYLAHALMAGRDYLRGLAEGAIHKTIYMPTLKGLRIRLPSLAEQDRVLARIAELEKARADTASGLDRQAAALNALAPALLTAAFQGQL